MKIRLAGMKRITALLLSVLMLMTILCGCKSSSIISEEEAQTPILTVDQYTVTLDEVYLYYLQYIFNNNLMPSQVTEASAQTITTYVVQQIQMEYVQYQLAIASEITLSEEDMLAAENSANAFYNHFGEEFLSKYSIDYDLVYNMFVRTMYINDLSEKAMQDLADEYLAQYEEEYADLNFHVVYYALFPSIAYDENGQAVINESGEYVTLSEEEMAQQLALAEEFRERAVSGDETMEQLVEEYGIAFCSGIERNYSGAYIAELNEVVDNLDLNEISEVVETDAGYMIVRMDNLNDEEFKLYSLQYMASQNARTLFPTLQENWMNASGVAYAPVDYDTLATVDIAAMCAELSNRGLQMQ